MGQNLSDRLMLYFAFFGFVMQFIGTVAELGWPDIARLLLYGVGIISGLIGAFNIWRAKKPDRRPRFPWFFRGPVMLAAIFLPLAFFPDLFTGENLPLEPLPVQVNQNWEPVTETIRVEESEIEVVQVPPGRFTPFDRRENEIPIADAYWIDKFEVTYALFGECTTCGSPGYLDDERYYGPDRPVVGISVEDATAYCNSVGGQLPTEDQWEYAARGPSGGMYPDNVDDPRSPLVLVNYADLRYGPRGSTISDDGFAGSSPVGSFPEESASWVGAYDMIGNVWEYTSGTVRGKAIIRGGSFRRVDPSYFSRDFYSYESSDDNPDHIGFRCVYDTLP